MFGRRLQRPERRKHIGQTICEHLADMFRLVNVLEDMLTQVLKRDAFDTAVDRVIRLSGHHHLAAVRSTSDA